MVVLYEFRCNDETWNDCKVISKCCTFYLKDDMDAPYCPNCGRDTNTIYVREVVISEQDQGA